MAILKRENKNSDFFMILAWLCRFNIIKTVTRTVLIYQNMSP